MYLINLLKAVMELDRGCILEQKGKVETAARNNLAEARATFDDRAQCGGY